MEVVRRSPQAIICLLSALRFHGLTTQNPLDVWILIETKARRPAIQTPRLRVVRASGLSLESGVKVHRIEGTRVRVTSIAKTVCDCFRYRSKIGLDVAVESLREALDNRRASVDELHKMAVIDRVANVMRPYMESLA